MSSKHENVKVAECGVQGMIQGSRDGERAHLQVRNRDKQENPWEKQGETMKSWEETGRNRNRPVRNRDLGVQG